MGGDLHYDMLSMKQNMVRSEEVGRQTAITEQKQRGNAGQDTKDGQQSRLTEERKKSKDCEI